MYFWSCSDECKYSCMWLTVDAYKKDNSGVPQFYGKVILFKTHNYNIIFNVFFTIFTVAFHKISWYPRASFSFIFSFEWFASYIPFDKFQEESYK